MDPRLVLTATGLLSEFGDGGVLTSADVHVARVLGRLAGEPDEAVLLATALAVRAVRNGSVCVDLEHVRRTVGTQEADDAAAPAGRVQDLPWPDPADWYERCEASPLIDVDTRRAESGTPLASDRPVRGDRPVRLVDRLLYLDRYWREEQVVRDEIEARTTRTPPAVDHDRLREVLAWLFTDETPDHQRLAVAACAMGWFTVIAGGPGTGKTTTVARLLAALDAVSDRRLRVALAAPTGKAAARLQEAVGHEMHQLAQAGVTGSGDGTRSAPEASTLHRLLGWRPDSRGRFRHNRTNRLPFDVVVVDETSMVSLTMMSRLLEAVRADARLVLVGDPDQLASVEAGAVLGDLVHRPPAAKAPARVAALISLTPGDMQPRKVVGEELHNDVVRLRKARRFGGAIRDLAEAVRAGDGDVALEVLRDEGRSEVAFVESDTAAWRLPADLDDGSVPGLRTDVMSWGRAVHEAASAGDAAAALEALDTHRVLCAHRRGPFGVERWSAEVRRWLRTEIDGYAGSQWYVGRPLLITANDYEVGLFNGDTGVVVDAGSAGLRAAFRKGQEIVVLAPNRLSAVRTVLAMTVHRGQGSQFRSVSVVLPDADSPLLTRELLYTAVTRARESVRVVGSEAAVRSAVAHRVVRASGLRGSG